MSSHPAILSICDALKTEFGVDISKSFDDPNTKKEIAGTVTITLKDIDEANDVAAAVRGHFASSLYGLEIKHQVELITKMYYLAVESTYCNATFFRDATPVDSQKEIQDLKNRVGELESTIKTISRGKDMEERVAKARASADNAHIVSRNSRLQYPYLYLALKKTILGTGIEKAQEVRPNNIAEDELASETASIGSLPRGFNREISRYSDKEILTMIIFYNDNFKIAREDGLPVRRDKFKSYLSEFAEIAEE